jgi:phenylalanyl-tRNA synthetase beta chain
MKFSESWLREWVNPALDAKQLSDRLTMGGLEIESLAPVAEKFTGVVVAEVISVAQHPEAERLSICAVTAGTSQTLTIVCGAPNVRAGMKVPAALENAVLAGDLHIKATLLRGVTSQGMLCSPQELGLGEDADGLFELPKDAPIGKDVWDYLNLNDNLIDVSITPNRGDCLGIRGLAKDVAALTQSAYNEPKIANVNAVIEDVLPITITAPDICPSYVGRIIRDVKANAPTPIWMREHLRRFGVRSISAIVDITNYVMIELGQPMHAFTLDKISGGIQVRLSRPDESIHLLDDSEVKLEANTLVIADDRGPLALGGVMGGMESAVTGATQNIFLEGAFFKATEITRVSRLYNISSESSYRYERGIDPAYQRTAMERATGLVLEIAGGKPGPVIEATYQDNLPPRAFINLRSARVNTLLGCEIEPGVIEKIFQSLGFSFKKNNDGWNVIVPARRSDISIEADLIEEIARLYGYDKIPCHQYKAALHIAESKENIIPLAKFRHALCDLGYNEVVTYSFIDAKLQTLFDPQAEPKFLVNPMSAEMALMRTTLWPGLINVLIYNMNRQQSRIRLFETGLRYIENENGLSQDRMLCGLITGTAQPEQWGIKSRAADFYDLKGDLENLFQLTHDQADFSFKPGSHPALHPGQTAEIYRSDRAVGMMGSLHPTIMRVLKLDVKVFLFELYLTELEQIEPLIVSEISKFPEIRRDLAILIDQSVPAKALQYTIREVAGELLKQVDIFDVYQGKGIEPGLKSIALALTLQHSSRTLIDEEVAELMNKVIVALNSQFNAELRG